MKQHDYKKFSDWHDLLQNSITKPEELIRILPVDKSKIDRIIEYYPMRINPYYFSLIKHKNCPIGKQAVPDMQEIEDINILSDPDPLCEEIQSPVPNLIHRYPGRVLFMVSAECAMYCRFCMRKRKVGYNSITDKTITMGLEYIKNNKSICEVVISGGDPLLLEDEKIDRILKDLRAIDHIEILRIHSRIPCTLPQRITKDLVDILRQYHPLFINIHFNHPDEITEEAALACSALADAGIPLGCQTVLLNGINNNAEIMKTLMKKLLMIRVKPYYIHQLDVVRGNHHFKATVKEGLNIMQSLYGYSGLCVPQYMIDLPGGGGKVPLLPQYFKTFSDDSISFINYEDKLFEYKI
ncbi:KamA family radical SAM protein [Desulfobacterium sp. N47]|uniref:KamA family radical SAM protein n=1 Tax=Desulfobacterium sp. N47 TaxID=3115210 RepID=UPI003C905637